MIYCVCSFGVILFCGKAFAISGRSRVFSQWSRTCWSTRMFAKHNMQALQRFTVSTAKCCHDVWPNMNQRTTMLTRHAQRHMLGLISSIRHSSLLHSPVLPTTGHGFVSPAQMPSRPHEPGHCCCPEKPHHLCAPGAASGMSLSPRLPRCWRAPSPAAVAQRTIQGLLRAQVGKAKPALVKRSRCSVSTSDLQIP